MRLVRTLAWTGAAANVAMFVIAIVLAVGGPKTPAGTFGGLWPASFVAMAVVGAFIASHRTRNATGWLFLGGGSLMVVNGFAQAYANYSLAEGHQLPATHFVAWLGFWTWMPAVALISLAMFLFPTGHPRSPFWRGATILGYAIAAVTPILALPSLHASSRELMTAPTPGAVSGGAALDALNVPLPLFLALGFGGAVARFVRARGVERLQMKWFVYGTSILAVATLAMFVMAVALGIDDPISNPVASGLVLIGMMAIPISAAIGILRYRLFDIDRVISRTMSYGVLTALLGGSFALVVLLPTAVIGSGRTPGWLVAAGTLIAFGLFRPVRRRVQNTVDHRFNRKRYDAIKTVESFSARLRDQTDLETLRDELGHVIGETMQPTSVSVWLRTDEEG